MWLESHLMCARIHTKIRQMIMYSSQSQSQCLTLFYMCNYRNNKRFFLLSFSFYHSLHLGIITLCFLNAEFFFSHHSTLHKQLIKTTKSDRSHWLTQWQMLKFCALSPMNSRWTKNSFIWFPTQNHLYTIQNKYISNDRPNDEKAIEREDEWDRDK